MHTKQSVIPQQNLSMASSNVLYITANVTLYVLVAFGGKTIEKERIDKKRQLRERERDRNLREREMR